MRDIEGIERVVATLRPHWSAIDDHFAAENRAYIALISNSHDQLGRVLKCHLVVEHYIERFLSAQIPHVGEARLSFAQKAKLLPKARTAAAFVRPGIIQLNTIRNRFAHDLGATVTRHDLGPITDVLDVSRPEIDLDDPVRAIEAFTTVACTFLIVPPPELQQVFVDAFRAIRVRDNSEDAV
jgi:hypothetical protein